MVLGTGTGTNTYDVPSTSSYDLLPVPVLVPGI